MAIIDGIDFVLYFNTTALADVQQATVTGTTWSVGESMQAVEYDTDRPTSETTVRGAAGSGGRVIKTPGSRSDSYTLTIAYDKTDPLFVALKTAYNNKGTEIALAFFDGLESTSGTAGEVGNFTVSKFGRSEAESGPATMSVEVAPTTVFDPEFVVA